MSAYTDCVVFCSVSTRTTEVRFHVSSVWHAFSLLTGNLKAARLWKKEKSTVSFFNLNTRLVPHFSFKCTVWVWFVRGLPVMSQSHYGDSGCRLQHAQNNCKCAVMSASAALWTLTGSWALTQESVSVQTIKGAAVFLFWWSWMRLINRLVSKCILVCQNVISS